jgi:CBS domain-containing protein
MATQGVGSVIVVRDRRPIGIVTDRDLAVRVLRAGLDAESTPVQEVMTTPVHVVRDVADLAEAAAAMRAARVRRLVVVDAEGRLVGIVSLDDLVRHLGGIGRDLADLTSSSPVLGDGT